MIITVVKTANEVFFILRNFSIAFVVAEKLYFRFYLELVVFLFIDDRRVDA